METGSLSFNPCGYLNPMTALARRVAIGKHEVFFLTQQEKGIGKPFGAVERCLASCGRGETLELPKEVL